MFPSNFDYNNSMRIIDLNIKNFTNIENGQVNLGYITNLLHDKADIRGIYGQNGTGKTSIIKAIKLIKNLIIGNPLQKDIAEYLMYEKKQFEIKMTFLLDTNNKKYLFEYSVQISKISFNPNTDNKDFWGIKNESLKFKDSDKNSPYFSKIKTLIESDFSTKGVKPIYRNNEIENFFDSKFDYEYIQRSNIENQKSFIFDSNLAEIIIKKCSKKSELRLIPIIKNLSLSNIHIIDSNSMALSSANILLPLNFNIKNNNHNYRGVLPISIAKPQPIPLEIIDIVDAVLNETNKVLKQIIPGLSICTKKLQAIIDDKGKEKTPIELLSCRKNIKIPIRYESDGIKKIISVLNLIINMYNNRSMIILIDELDAGIFEYLLGEILLILEENGKGQLIFTSHNLRPLEILKRDSLIFTTTNPTNRYIKIKNIRPNNNIRDVYYRGIVLDGQDEIIYEKTDSALIKRSLRKAKSI